MNEINLKQTLKEAQGLFHKRFKKKRTGKVRSQYLSCVRSQRKGIEKDIPFELGFKKSWCDQQWKSSSKCMKEVEPSEKG